MKEGWRMVKFSEVAQVVGGSTPKTNVKSFWNGDNYWVTPAELKGEKYINKTERTITDEAISKTNLTLLPKGTVLLSSRAPIGKVCITNVPMFCNQGFKNIVCKDSLYNEFVYYYLLYSVPYLESLGTGATFKEISKRVVENVEIPLPPLKKQHRIVSILDASFEKIDALKKNAEENLKNAKALFQQVLAQELKPKEGWVEKKLGEVSSVRIGPFGSLLHKKDYIIGGTPLVNPVHMKNGVIYMDDNFTVSKEKEIELNNYILRTNDIVFARRGEIGRCALVTEKENGYLCGTGSLFVRFIEKVNSRFMLLMFQSAANKQYLIDNASGATMLNINSDIVMNMPICLPEIEEQHRIVQTLDTLSEKCSRLEQVAQQTIRECDALKQSILRQAFSGEL